MSMVMGKHLVSTCHMERDLSVAFVQSVCASAHT